jgi:diphosphomevalonate decarboxylase
MATAVSYPNIALIKYWGNRNDALRLPAADSLSITLDAPSIEATVQPADTFAVHSFDAQGIEKPQSTDSINRLQKHWTLTAEYIKSVNAGSLPTAVSLHIVSSIPPSIGIASSAAVFSCLAEAYATLASRPLTREEVSVIARLGSGSAARSVMGGFVALLNTPNERMDAAVARQIAPAAHWNLHDIIIVPSEKEKKVGSTEGHAKAHTSPLFKERVAVIPSRMKECIDAIEKKDFEKLQYLSELDALDMHKVMETQTPALHYLSDDTHCILKEIESLRKNEHLEVLYTMDAGPTVHLICTDSAQNRIEAFARSQKDCRIFISKIGNGSCITKS